MHGPNSFAVHVQTKHYQYWAKAKRLRLVATLNLIISLFFTILLASFFYFPNELGYTTMALAALFLALSAAFSLRERGLAKRFTRRTEEGQSRVGVGSRRRSREGRHVVD